MPRLKNKTQFDTPLRCLVTFYRLVLGKHKFPIPCSLDFMDNFIVFQTCLLNFTYKSIVLEICVHRSEGDGLHYMYLYFIMQLGHEICH